MSPGGPTITPGGEGGGRGGGKRKQEQDTNPGGQQAAKVGPADVRKFRHQHPIIVELLKPLLAQEKGRLQIFRLIDAVAHANPQDGDIRFSKLDVKDGFWRMNVEEGAEWNFAYVLPGGHPDDPELVMPQALQMGWAESPPFFL